MAFTGRGINTIRTVGNQTKSGRIDFQNNYELIWNSTTSTGNKDVSMILGNTIDANGSTITNLASRKIVNDTELYATLQTFITASGKIGTYAPASAEKNSIVTSLNHGDNFMLLGNGLKFQWGVTTLVNGQATVNLHAPFATTNYQVMCTCVARSGFTPSCITKTTTYIQLDSCYYNGVRAGSEPVLWIAIGY